MTNNNLLILDTEFIKLQVSSQKDNVNNINTALCISPNIPFSSQNIPYDTFNVFIALDMSGSMKTAVETIKNTNNINSNNSRFSYCISAISLLIKFFRKLTSSNKQVYLWIYGFNSSVFTLLENKLIINDDVDTDYIMKKCNRFEPLGCTNMDAVIRDIQGAKASLINNSNTKTISLLLSDGFTNTGRNRNDIMRLYPSFFDVTIGIGNDDDYDQQLLSNLSKENFVRGCITSDDIYDQIIGSVFEQFDIYASQLSIYGLENTIDTLLSNVNYEFSYSDLTTDKKGIIINNLRYSQPIILSFTHNYEQSLSLNLIMTNNHESFNPANIIAPSFAFKTEYNSDKRNLCIAYSLDNNTFPDTGYYKEINEYLMIIKSFNTFDITNKNQVINIKNQIINLINLINNNQDPPLNIIKIILEEYKVRVESLLSNILENEQQNDIHFDFCNNTHNNTSENNTPNSIPYYKSPLTHTQSISAINHIRRRTGNITSLSRMASQEYSQSSD
jgi:hypothetical protein